ncbi:MAG: PQQ-binding-like beta-propeller repeat protein [Candidatus Hydrogenedentes bacterium]|nr:PQQ-binding-like beta-propeller repeat protein [Candidatus Hydrogenedentota bacterium]
MNDNEEESYLLALDKNTGVEVWRTPRDEKSNWSTPFVWQHEKRTEIVTAGSGLNRSSDLDGNLLWSLKGMSKITIATPYAADGLLYLSSGYVGDKQRPVYAIRPGAGGDITLAEGQTSNERIAWSYPQAAPYNPSTLVYDGQLYVLYDGGLLACFNAKDGAVIFERQRIPEARNFTASPWAYNGRVFCLNEDGVTYVVKAGNALEVVHTNALGNPEAEIFLATPAITGDRLLIRSSARLYCIKNQQ